MFDKKAYRDSVLQPYKANAAWQSSVAHALRALSDTTDRNARIQALAKADATVLFALTPGMSSDELTKHIKSLDMFLNKSRIPVVLSISQLLKAVKKALGESLYDPTLWAAVRKQASAAGQEELDAFVRALKQDNPIGVLTVEELRRAATSSGIGSSLTDRDLSAAATRQGIRVCPRVDVREDRKAALASKIRLHPSFRNVVDVLVLHERAVRPKDIRVIDELSAVVGSNRRRMIGMADLRQSQSAANARSDDASESAKKTLTALAEQCSTDADVCACVLAWFADQAEQLRRQGLTQTLALGRLTSMGLADLDARRLLARVPTNEPTLDFASVTDMIAAGALARARRAYTVVAANPGDEAANPLSAQVGEALAAAESRKSAAMDAYRRAFAVRDYAAARAALADARAVDREDEEISDLLLRIPPDPPTVVSAAFDPDRGGVLVSWRGVRDDDVCFAVVRSDAGVPANPTSDFQVASAVRDQQVLDRTPVVAREVVYAVFAFHQGGVCSAPATARVTVLPPPFETGVVVTATEATVFWRTPDQATGVSVELVGADGGRRTFPVSTKGRQRLDGLRLGQTYTALLQAHFIVGGRPAFSQMVEVPVTARGLVRPVEDLRLGNTRMPNGKPGIRAEWTDIPGYTTDVWTLPADAPVSQGDRVTVKRLDELGGTKIVGVIRSSGNRQSMDIHEQTGVHLYVPLTWDGDEAVAGRAVVAGTAPPPRDVRVERFGTQLSVSWVWPSGDYLMDVVWTSVDGRTDHMRVDKFSYKRDGGVRIVDADTVTEVSVGTVVVGVGNERVCSPVTVELEAVAPALSYELKLPRRFFGGRNATVNVTSEGFRGVAELVAVLSTGPYMPARVQDGEEIARLELDFSSGLTQSRTFQVPTIKGAYWVRLFAGMAARIQLSDPPTSSLKG